MILITCVALRGDVPGKEVHPRVDVNVHVQPGPERQLRHPKLGAAALLAEAAGVAGQQVVVAATLKQDGRLDAGRSDRLASGRRAQAVVVVLNINHTQWIAIVDYTPHQ